MRSNWDGVSTPSLPRRSQNVYPSLPTNERKTASSRESRVVSFKILDSRPCIKNDYAFTGCDFSGGAKHFQSCEARRSFGADEETLACSNFTRDSDHLFIINGN